MLAVVNNALRKWFKSSAHLKKQEQCLVLPYSFLYVTRAPLTKLIIVFYEGGDKICCTRPTQTQMVQTDTMSKTHRRMHVAHGERRKMLPVCLCSRHVTAQLVCVWLNTSPPAASALHIDSHIWKYDFSTLFLYYVRLLWSLCVSVYVVYVCVSLYVMRVK